MFVVTQPHSIWVRVEKENGENATDFDLNQFIELFLPEGPLEFYNEHVFGITTRNFVQKIFTVTFLEHSASINISKLMANFENGQTVETATGKRIKLTTHRPPPPTETVTLYPMPHGIQPSLLSKITSGWGVLKSFEYGRHKVLPHIRNSYLHLKFTDINLANIPQRIVVNQHYVAVVKPSESLALRCGFCKIAGHRTFDCPEKRPPLTSGMRIGSNLGRPQRGWNIQNPELRRPALSVQTFPPLEDHSLAANEPKLQGTKEVTPSKVTPKKVGLFSSGSTSDPQTPLIVNPTLLPQQSTNLSETQKISSNPDRPQSDGPHYNDGTQQSPKHPDGLQQGYNSPTLLSEAEQTPNNTDGVRKNSKYSKEPQQNLSYLKEVQKSLGNKDSSTSFDDNNDLNITKTVNDSELLPPTNDASTDQSQSAESLSNDNASQFTVPSPNRTAQHSNISNFAEGSSVVELEKLFSCAPGQTARTSEDALQFFVNPEIDTVTDNQSNGKSCEIKSKKRKHRKAHSPTGATPPQKQDKKLTSRRGNNSLSKF